MRRIRYVLAVPLLLPFLAASFTRADDAPKPEAPKPDAPKDEAPKADPVKPDAATPADATKPVDTAKKDEPKKAADAIAWLHDYDAAKTKAAGEKKGLFVYMTPSWFT